MVKSRVSLGGQGINEMARLLKKKRINPITLSQYAPWKPARLVILTTSRGLVCFDDW